MSYEPQAGLEYYFGLIGAKIDELIYSARLFFHVTLLRHNVNSMKHCSDSDCNFSLTVCYTCKHKILGWERLE